MKVPAIVIASSLLFAVAVPSAPGRQRCADRVDRRHRQPGRHRRRQARASRRRRNAEVKKFARAHGHRPHRRQQVGGRSGDQAQGHAGGQPDQPEPQVRRRRSNVASLKTLEGRRVRQGLHRPRSRLSPASARRRRQDADPQRQERGAEGAAGQGAAGVRRAPRARQDDPVVDGRSGRLDGQEVLNRVPVNTTCVSHRCIFRRGPGPALLEHGPGRGGRCTQGRDPLGGDRRHQLFNPRCLPSRSATRSRGSTRIRFRTP